MATVTARISPADHGRAMTLDEFLDAEEEGGYRYELARGVLEVTHVPDDPHGVVVCHLYNAVGQYYRAHPGYTYRYGGGSEFRLWLPGMVSGRNPDVSVALGNAPKDLRGRRLASLAVEVVSEGGESRDYVTKREEYLAYGLLEYWIVDPAARKVMVLVRNGDVWAERVFEGEQMIEGLVLPGLGLRVSELWPEDEGGEE